MGRTGWMVILVAGLCLASAFASAQTLYNAPGQSTEGAGAQPLNLRELMRREQAAQAERSRQTQSNIPYAAMPGASAGASFAQRQAALNQWRNQRDTQAWEDQQNSLAYMASLKNLDTQFPFRMEDRLMRGEVLPQGTIGQPTQTIRPMIYRRPDEDTIRTPRRLFNTPE